jgi:hypothetical protein
MKYIGWDTLSLGSIGFAQVGNERYHEKSVIEKKVISAYYNANMLTRVPQEFFGLANFSWQLCAHDIHSYSDFVIQYDRDVIEELEESDPEMFKRFWDWEHQCESDMGNKVEFLTELCNKAFRENVTMIVIHKAIDEEQGLKAV